MRTLNFKRSGDFATLTIIVDHEVRVYAVRPGYRVLYLHGANGDYKVHRDGSKCTCPGHSYHGKCKHRDAVRKLVELGKVGA